MALVYWPPEARIRSAEFSQRISRIRQTSAWTGRTRDIALGPADRWQARISLSPTKSPATIRAMLAQLARAGTSVRMPMGARAQGDVSGNLAADSGFELGGWWPYNNGGAPASYSLVAGGVHGVAQRIVVGTPVGTTLGALNVAVLPGGWRPETDYVVSVYARTDSGAGLTGLLLGWNRPPQSTTVLLNPAPSGVWQRYAWRIRWAAGRPIENTAGGGVIYITAGGSWAAGDDLWLDDVMIEEASALSAWSAGLRLTSAPAGATTAAFAGAPALALLALAGQRITIPLAGGEYQAVTLATDLRSDASGAGSALWVQPLRAAAVQSLVATRWPFADMRLAADVSESVEPGPLYSFSTLQLEEAF